MKIKAIMALILVLSVAALAGCGVTTGSDNGAASTEELTQELEAIEREAANLIHLQGNLRRKAAKAGRFGETPESIRLEAEADGLDRTIESTTDRAWEVQHELEGKE